MSTFCSQNFGAGQFNRVKTGIRQSLFLCWLWVLVIIFLAYTCAPFFIYLVTGTRETAVTDPASLYLKVNSLFYFVSSGISILRNGLQAIGDHITPVFSSLIELVGKILIAFLLAPVLGYMGIIIAEPIIWCFMVIPLIVKVCPAPVRRIGYESPSIPLRILISKAILRSFHFGNKDCN